MTGTIITGEPEAVYHARDEVSNSSLAALARSPYHYYHQHVLGDVQQQQTAAMALGSAVHTAVLEPELWERRYYVDAGNTRQDARSVKFQAVIEAAGGRHVLKQTDADRVQAIRDAVLGDPVAARVLGTEDADNEVTVLWTDAATGIECRGRIDRLDRQGGYLIDLKTCRDASPRSWQRAIWDRGYDRQAAMYCDGLVAAGLAEATSWPMIWVCVEVEPPHAVAVYGCADLWIEVGRSRYRHLLRVLQRCRETDSWPAYCDDIEVLSPPAWALEQSAEYGWEDEPTGGVA